MVAADIITPKEFIGPVMDLCQDHRGQMGTMEYISTERVEMHYRIPLAEVVFDFFDQLKSRTKGYASARLPRGRRAGSRSGEGGYSYPR